MEAHTYRVTATVGGWRSVPWPFGLFYIDEAGLAVRSWHWSRWVPDSRAERHEIVDIQISRVLSVVVLLIKLHTGRTWRVQLAGTRLSRQVLSDLQHQRYLHGPSDRPAVRRPYEFYQPADDSPASKPAGGTLPRRDIDPELRRS